MDEAARAQKVVAHMMEQDTFSQWLGIRVLEASPGNARVAMTVRADMLNGFKVGHGGVTFSLADSALAFASNGFGQVSLSIEASMSYPASVHEGDTLTAFAQELAASTRIAHYQVTVSNQKNEPVGLFKGTVYRTKKPHFPELE